MSYDPVAANAITENAKLREQRDRLVEVVEDLQVYPACVIHGNISTLKPEDARILFDESEAILAEIEGEKK